MYKFSTLSIGIWLATLIAIGFFIFYIAIMLLPFFLAAVGIFFIFNVFRNFFNQSYDEKIEIFYDEPNKQKRNPANSKIVDAEYEILDK